jgi:hypothetical protein
MQRSYALGMSMIAAAVLTFTAAPAAAQSIGRGGQFSTYRVKPGKDAAFIAGYRKHLAWHVRARDRWPWYMWKVASGPRAGMHVGGSFEHEWAEFERRPNTKEDAADHKANIDGHLDGSSAVYLERRRDLGGALASFEAPYLSLVEVNVRPGERAAFERAVRASARRARPFPHAWFEVVSGADVSTYLLFISLQRRADLGAASPGRLDLVPAEGVASARSELLQLLPDTSTCLRPETRCLGMASR